MARKNATVTDAKANAEKVSTDATVAAEAPKKNDAKRKRTEETPQDSAATKGPAPKRTKLDANDWSVVRNYANSVHITHLAAGTTREALAKHFSDVGTVTYSLIYQRGPLMGKNSYVSGQVEFSSPASVAKAIKKDQSVLEGATISVKAAAAPVPPKPFLAIRAVGLEPSVTKDELKSALAKWADKIVKIKVPTENGANKGIALIRCVDVETATDIVTNFKIPIKGSVLQISYQRENPELEAHNAKLRAKVLAKKELNKKRVAKEIALAKQKKESRKIAAQKVHEKAQEKIRKLKEQQAAQAAKNAEYAKKIKEQQNAQIKKIKEQAQAKLSKRIKTKTTTA